MDFLCGKLIVMSKVLSLYEQHGNIKNGRVKESLSLLILSTNSGNCERLIPRLRSTAGLSRSFITAKCPGNIINSEKNCSC